MRDYNYDLMTSCVDGNLQGVKDALAHGADINTTDQQGHTPLMFALKNNKQQIVDYLLSQGADTTTVAQDGFSAQEHISKKPSPRQNNALRKLALCASKKGGLEIPNIIYKKGMNINE